MPQLNAIGIVSSDMARSISFYRELGLDVPDTPDEGHVDTSLPNGLRLMLDTEETVLSFRPDWTRETGNQISLALECDSPADVDVVYARVTAAGFDGEKEPWDAFWGQRYAQLRDPDGVPVDLYARSCLASSGYGLRLRRARRRGDRRGSGGCRGHGGAGAGFVMTAGTGVGTIVTVWPAATGSAFVGEAGAGVAVVTTTGASTCDTGSTFRLLLSFVPSVARGCSAGCAAGAEVSADTGSAAAGTCSAAAGACSAGAAWTGVTPAGM